jgi:hypothetical protein
MNGRVTSDFGDVPAPSIARLHDVKLRLGGECQSSCRFFLIAYESARESALAMVS